MLRRSPIVATLAALALSWGLASRAPGGVVEGDPAPAFEGKEFYNTPKITLADLRGQVLLYEIFRTW